MFRAFRRCIQPFVPGVAAAYVGHGHGFADLRGSVFLPPTFPSRGSVAVHCMEEADGSPKKTPRLEKMGCVEALPLTTLPLGYAHVRSLNKWAEMADDPEDEFIKEH